MKNVRSIRVARCVGAGSLAAVMCLLNARSLSAQQSARDQKTQTAQVPGSKPAGDQSSQSTSKPPSQQPPSPPQLKLENPETAPVAKPVQPKAPQPGAQVLAKHEVPNVIQEIIFRGNRRIPTSTLRARMLTHPGDAYDENALERDFHALWNTGYLDDIRFEVSDGDRGKILTVFVREKKIVRSIDYKGMSSITQSDVLDRFKQEKVGLTIDSQYDPVVERRAEVVLKEMLAERGRQFATVKARTRNIPPNSVALTFVVVEGPKVKVGAIRFTGNTVFNGMRLERAMKYSRPAGAPPFFYIFHKTYDKDKIEADLEKIRELYQDHGYFFALPKEPQVKMVDTRHRWPFFFYSWGRGKRVDVTIPIEEGSQYRLGKFVIRGNKLFKEAQLQPILQMKTGDVFNFSKVRDGIKNYTKLYGQFGYINFNANPDVEPDRKKRIVNLALDFEEGSQYFVHRIEFSGNTKTRDKVIRRELLLDEGNVFSSTLWDYSLLRINQLGFFNEVKKEDVDIQQNNKDHTVDLLVKVKEKGRNSIGFSGGISGLAGNFVGLNYATNNFLGLGETLSIESEFGTFEKLYSFGFTEPYLFDRPITSGFTVFKSDYHYDQLRQTAAATGLNPAYLQASLFGQYTQNFQQNSSGFTVFASYPLHRVFARVGLTYSYSVSSLQAFNTASQSFFQAINFDGLAGPNSLSGITSSSVMPTYTFNTVNAVYNPTKGKYIYGSVAFSGSVLGGNVNTVQPTLEFKYYHPINKGHDVLAFHLVGTMIAGYGGRVAPPFSRLYIGGEEDIRGFYIRTISPVAFFPTVGTVCNLDNTGKPINVVNSSGQQTGTCGSFSSFPYNTIIYPGGDTSVIGSFEYRIPIARVVTLAYFIDAGEDMALFGNQLTLAQSSLGSLRTQFPDFPTPTKLKPIASTNYLPRSSTGLQLQITLPIIQAPVSIFYGYNWLRLNTNVTPPQDLPSPALFPNRATYNEVLPFFEPLNLRDRSGRLGFTVARTF